jgi:hypothetical protein
MTQHVVQKLVVEISVVLVMKNAVIINVFQKTM